MKIVQSPSDISYLMNGSTTLFLAGGISNCPNWQDYVCKQFQDKYKDSDLVIINPRRVGDLAKTGNDTIDQINWEHKYLMQADFIMFWFPEETLCPITLFELGKMCGLLGYHSSRNIIVGMHHNYQRKFDLQVQLPLIDYRFKFSYSIDDLIKETANKIGLKEKI